jgi:ketosteroid isomerase-like protein
VVSADDVERLREGYENFNRGDFEAIFALLDDEFFVQDRDDLPDPQVYRGIKGAERAFAWVGEDFDEYSIEPEEMVDGGDWVVVVARQRERGKLSGAEVGGRGGGICHLWRLRDGLATELRPFSTREETLTAARDLGWPSS